MTFLPKIFNYFRNARYASHLISIRFYPHVSE